MAVRREHDQGNSDKGKHLIWADLQFERFSPSPSWPEASQYAGRYGARRDESSTSHSEGRQEEVGSTMGIV